MKLIHKGDVDSIKGKDCELKGVVTELTKVCKSTTF